MRILYSLSCLTSKCCLRCLSALFSLSPIYVHCTVSIVCLCILSRSPLYLCLLLPVLPCYSFQRMHLRSLPALLSASAPTLLLSASAPTLLLSDSVVCTQITLLCVCTHITPLCLCSQVTPVCLCTHVTPVCLCGLYPRYFASVSVVLYPRHFYNLTNVLSYAPSYGHIGTLNRGVGMGPQGFMNPGHGTLGRAGKPPSQPTYST